MSASEYVKTPDALVDAESDINETLIKDSFRDSDENLRSAINLGNSFFDQFAGSGTDGPRADVGSVSDSIDGLQFTTWSIDATFTVTLTDAITRFAVNGLMTMDGILDASGVGLAGGTAGVGPGGGSDGGENTRIGMGGATAGGGGGTSGFAGGDGGGVLGLAGAAGGTTGGGAGTAGTAAAGDALQTSWWMDLSHLSPSPGGGGGAEEAAGTAGNGGAGAGVIYGEIEELVFSATGVFRANGIAGVAATVGNAGGGGGGAGGTVDLICRKITTNLGLVEALQGALGAGFGTGAAGAAGGLGRTKLVEVPT